MPVSSSKREANASLFCEHGAVAKRLCTGLQIRVGRFDSGPRLQYFFNEINKLARFSRAFLCPPFPENPPISLPLLRKSVAMLRFDGLICPWSAVDFPCPMPHLRDMAVIQRNDKWQVRIDSKLLPRKHFATFNTKAEAQNYHTC